MDVPELTAAMFAKRASVRRRMENPRRNHTALLELTVQGPGTIDIVRLDLTMGPWIRGHMRGWHESSVGVNVPCTCTPLCE